MTLLSDRVAIVTGGAGGIGSAACAVLARDGAEVVVADIAPGSDIVSRIVADGGWAEFHELDVSDDRSWAALADSVIERHGRIDILVNAAGVADLSSLAESTVESWTRIVEINQTGTFLGMKHVAAAMSGRPEGGAIVNVASIAGLVKMGSGSIAYHASKGAVRAMTTYAAVELAPMNIRVNAVLPGRVETPMLRMQTTEKASASVAQTPLGRGATPLEVAEAIGYLASPKASFVTGAELVIDGGYTSR